MFELNCKELGQNPEQSTFCQRSSEPQAFVLQTDGADHLVILLADEVETRYDFITNCRGNQKGDIVL